MPAFVALVALASGRGSAGPVAWTGFAIAIAGVVLVAGGGGASSLLGDLLVLLAAAISALYVVAQPAVLNGPRPRRRDRRADGGRRARVAAVRRWSSRASPRRPPRRRCTRLTAFAALAGLGSVVPFVLYAYGQKRVTPEVAGAFVNLEPLVGAAIGAFAFGDPFGPAQLLGAAAIVGGIMMSVEPAGARRCAPRSNSPPRPPGRRRIASISSSIAAA